MSRLDTIEMIKTSISPILEQEEVSLIEINLGMHKGRWLLKLLVDKINGGITLDECSRLNEKIGNFIERESIIEQSYTLEISSPGMDRPLFTAQDFSRCLNRRLRILFNQCQDGKYEISGVLSVVSDMGIELKSEGQNKQIPFDQIKKAKQIIEVD